MPSATVPTPLSPQTSIRPNGFYKFSDVIPGLYTVVGANLSSDYKDVADCYDSVGDCNPQDDGSVVVDHGNVSVKLNSAGEDDVMNDFVDKLKKRFISGGLTDDQGSGNKFACAMINLKFGGAVVDTRIIGLKLGGALVDTRIIRPDGAYSCTAQSCSLVTT